MLGELRPPPICNCNFARGACPVKQNNYGQVSLSARERFKSTRCNARIVWFSELPLHFPRLTFVSFRKYTARVFRSIFADLNRFKCARI